MVVANSPGYLALGHLYFVIVRIMDAPPCFSGESVKVLNAFTVEDCLVNVANEILSSFCDLHLECAGRP